MNLCLFEFKLASFITYPFPGSELPVQNELFYGALQMSFQQSRRLEI